MKQAKIVFKVKPALLDDGAVSVPVPKKFKRTHCNMNAFRRHPKYGPYANSDLFDAILARIRHDQFGNRDGFKMSEKPSNVKVIEGDFLWEVEVSV